MLAHGLHRVAALQLVSSLLDLSIERISISFFESATSKVICPAVNTHIRDTSGLLGYNALSCQYPFQIYGASCRHLLVV